MRSMERLPYQWIVVGLGAVYQEYLAKPLSLLTDPRTHILIDREGGRFQEIKSSGRIISDINHPPFASNTFSDLPVVAVIATPEHLKPLETLSELGVRKFVIEKPLVSNQDEIGIFRKIVRFNTGLKVYALEMCITKVLPLYLLTGRISPDDPRWTWVKNQYGRVPSEKLYNSLESQIGEIEGIDGIVLEGGDFGIPDLVLRPWLESDKKTGGMLLDLGTHIFSPLITAGLIASPDSVQVDIAREYILSEDRKTFIEAAAGQPEMYVDALLGIRYEGRNIPLSIKLAKTFHQGGIWKLLIRGSKGDISIGLRTGQPLTIEPNRGNSIQLRLAETDGYSLSLAEADLYFQGLPGFDGNQRALLDSIQIIDKIKKHTTKVNRVLLL